jgi:chemotaxis regulatin CheY-phosphate phosphatase CheZ
MAPQDRNGSCTHIVSVEDLTSALAELVTAESPHKLKLLRETLLGIRSGFDPASIAMSSTNIPDAILKLSSVLNDSNEASHKVFDLVESQHKILKQGEKHLAELEQLAQQGPLGPEAALAFVSKFRALNHAMQAVSNDIVISQEFQDLCGQRVKKVMRLVCDVEVYLKALLEQLKVDLPNPKSAAELEAEQSVDQESTDALLKELGL